MKNKCCLLLLLVITLAACKSKKAVIATPLLQQTVVKESEMQKQKAIEEEKARIEPEFAARATNDSVSLAHKADIKYSTKSVSPKSGVERIAEYDFTHPDVPKAFDGFRIAFISDLHYKSLLLEKGLNNIVSLLIDQKPDVLLMGGDYQEGCKYVEPLFAALAKVKTPMGTYGVMGNNDYERCHEDIVSAMERHGMHVLEHKLDTLRKDGQQIILAGVRNPFDLANNGQSPTLQLSDDDFVILLVHTPDYVEDVSVANTDLALAGHTHGGQVRIFGIAPILVSHYGTRFLSGLSYSSAETPIIVTNGIGTSQKPIRIGAPAEIVMITLHCSTSL